MLNATFVVLSLAGQLPPSGHLACSDLSPLIEQMTSTHYARRTVAPLAEQRSVHQFIKALDPAKMLLLQRDVVELERELPQVFQRMRRGQCDVLQRAARLVISRAKEDQKIVEALLAKDYVLDENVKIIIDPDERGYAKTEAERADRVRRMVHFQISNQLLSGTSLKRAKKRVAHRYALAARRLGERRAPTRLPGLYAKAYASSLDPHSDYLSPEFLANFQIQMRLSLEGIGAVLRSEDGYTLIQSIVPGGQADKEGTLRPKDKIIAVAQEREDPVSVIDMDLQDVVKMIRGKKGTKVTLSVLRGESEASAFSVTIVRDKIDVKEQAAKMDYQTRQRGEKVYKIGVIDLPSFYGGQGGRSSYRDMSALLREARAAKVDGLVLDLSRNGGGLLDEAVRISGLFIDTGNIVATRAFNGEVELLSDEDDGALYTGPLVVLISHASASASEILAGALKDYRRAVVAGGGHTFGKGTVQQLSQLPGGLGAIKLTMGMFFRPAGQSTQQVGVSADVSFPSVLDGFDIAEKNLDYSLPTQSMSPFLSPTANGRGTDRFDPVSPDHLRALRRQSKVRVAQSAVFSEIVKDIEDTEKPEGPVVLKDLRARAKDTEKDEDAAKADFERKQSAFRNEGVELVVDLIGLQRS